MYSKSLLNLSLLSSLLPTLSLAHFEIKYPEWRGDSFQTGASQYIYPCANVSQTSTTNRTIWPLSGGSLNLDLHHPWTYVLVNLGLGTDNPVFNISLTPQPWNETGNGTLCLPRLHLPGSVVVSEGQNASLQVVTFGQTGAALYNCADITFSANATLLSGDSCQNSSNVVASVVNQEINGSTTGTPSTASTRAIGQNVLITGSIAMLGAVAFSLML